MSQPPPPDSLPSPSHPTEPSPASLYIQTSPVVPLPQSLLFLSFTHAPFHFHRPYHTFNPRTQSIPHLPHNNARIPPHLTGTLPWKVPWCLQLLHPALYGARELLSLQTPPKSFPLPLRAPDHGAGAGRALVTSWLLPISSQHVHR